jgi:membrane-associated phospholipid phosphatase
MLTHFFISYTFFGDGMFALMLTTLVFIFYKKRKLGFALLNSFIISGIAAQLVKRLFPSPRPKLFFPAGAYDHFIHGITLAGNNSFPSGHTATAFALAAVLASMLKGKRLQVFVLTAAALVGYSRIYLGQHFLLDVVAGAIIGWLSGIISVYLAQKIITSRFLSKMGTTETSQDISIASSNSHIPSA